MTTILEDLQRPEALPEPTRSVSVVHTHISMVFVADHHVYKVKKPVNFGFLDFSTQEKRLRCCRQEVELNRRLSKDVYLDVIPVRHDGTAHSLTGGPGRVVDHAVKMKRIPTERLMKTLFVRGTLTDTHLTDTAEVLARFHHDALRTSEIDVFGQRDRFRVNTDENFAQVEKYIGVSIRQGVFDALKRWTDDFYERNGALFAERIGQGKIRDCHGDLHMEHICLTRPISVIDCIEFNDRFRYSDTVADIAFLLMDLEYHGGEDRAATLWSRYRDRAGEGAVDSLLTFYKVYRAFVRGKVIGFQVDDDSIAAEDKEEAVRRAGKYFDLALSYIQ